MKVLILELLWQHTEVIGTWLEFFSRQGADITIYYPQFATTPHNYIHIWAKLYKFILDTEGQINLADYDLVVWNTTTPDLLYKLVADIPIRSQTRFLTVGHYSQKSIANWLLEDIDRSKRICEIHVNPFFSRRSATASATCNLPPSQPAKFILPVCRQLADAVADCRSAVLPTSGKKILIIGNSFKSVPHHIFNAFTGALRSAGWSLSAVLYGYNDISGYDLTAINVRCDLPAIDLYKEIEECRFILFLPANYHYFNQLSGTIPLSLTFGRPLITMENVLTPYNIQPFYNIGDPLLLQHLESADRYSKAQAHLQVRLNEIFTTNAEILEDSLRSIGLVGN